MPASSSPSRPAMIFVVAQSLPAGYVFDPADPRAPTHEQWVAMSPAERTRVVDMLPTSLPSAAERAAEDARRLAEDLSTKLAEEQRLREDERRLREDERRLREEAERRLAEAQAE